MSIETMRQALTGVSGVPVTAYDGNGEVAPRVTAKIYERVAVAGIHNIVAAGNTGEFYALTPEEIRRVHEAAISGVDGKAPVTAAIGRSLREAIRMAKDAASLGATAVMSHQPVDPFAAPASQIDYFRSLAEASPLPLVAYVRADGFSVDDMVRLAGHGNIAGIKFATTDLMLLSRAIAASDPNGALFVCGLAESWAPSFAAAGARGFTRPWPRAILPERARSSTNSSRSSGCGRSSATAPTSRSSKRRSPIPALMSVLFAFRECRASTRRIARSCLHCFAAGRRQVTPIHRLIRLRLRSDADAPLVVFGVAVRCSRS